MNGMHHLIARWLAFTASARDRKRLHAWKDRDEANAAWVDTLGAWWNNPAPRPENPRAEAVRAQLSERLDDRISTGNPGLRRLLRAVAAVAVLALVSWGSLYIASLSGYFDTEKRVAVSTRAGQQSCSRTVRVMAPARGAFSPVPRRRLMKKVSIESSAWWAMAMTVYPCSRLRASNQA